MEVTSPDVIDWVRDFPDWRLYITLCLSRRKLDLSLTVAFAAHWCTSTYKHCAKIDQNGDSAGKKVSEEASAKKNEGDSSGKPSLNFTETFKLHFQGPGFTVGDGYFVHCKGRNLQFERHIETVLKSFKQNFGLC